MTPEQSADQKLTEMYTRGDLLEEIAATFGVSTTTIRDRANRLGLSRPENRGKWQRSAPGHGRISRYERGCRCELCVEANRMMKRKSYERARPQSTPLSDQKKAELEARLKAQQMVTRAEATNSRKPWTAEDLNVALDYRHSAVEAARLIGRSLSAVRNARVRAKAKPEMLPYRQRETQSS